MIPTISTADLTVIAACKVLLTLQNTISTSASKAAARSTAIRDLRAIINPTLPPSAIAQRVGAALEPRVPPASITGLPGTRVLHPTISNSPISASLYTQNISTSINTTSHKLYVSTNTICEHNIPDILFLRSFNLNYTCSARGNVSYLLFFLCNKHTTFYGRLHVLYVSTI